MIKEIIFYIIGIILFLYVCNLIYQISNYFSTKEKILKKENKKKDNNISTIPLGDRINYSLDFLDLCNHVIDNEILKTLKTFTFLNSEYDLKRLDKDAQLIAKNVFESISPDVIIHKDMVVSEDYIMEYIVSESILRLLSVVKEYNNQIRKN